MPEFHKLNITDFLSYGSDTQEVELADKGLVLVEGINKDDPVAEHNASGKSSLLDALMWGVTGKPLRNLRGNDIIHRGADECLVEEWGACPSGDWRIRRHQGKKRGLEFYLNGKPHYNIKDSNATQAKINQALGISYRSMLHATVFGQGQKWRFTELDDNDRKKLFDELLGIEQLAEAFKRAKDDLSGFERAVQANLDERNKLKEKYSFLTRTKATLQSAIVSGLEDRLHDAQAELEAYKLGESPLTEVIRLKRERAKLLKKQSVLVAKVDEVAARVNEAQRQVQQEDFAIAELEKDRWVMEKAQPGERCPVCASKLTQPQIDLRNRSVDSQLKHAKFSRKDKQQTYLELSQRHNKLSTKANLYTSRIHSLELTLSRKRVELTTWKDARVRHNDLTKKVKDLEVRIAEAKVKSHTKEVARVRKDIALTKEALRTLWTELLHARDRVAYAQFWNEGYGNAGMKSHYLDHVIPILNERAADVSKYFMGGLSIKFDSQTQLKSGQFRDKIDIKVANKWGVDSYNGSSGSEQRKIDIVVAKVLQSIGAGKVESNISWWDEVFETIDESGCEAVVSMLQDELQHRSSVFVVTHLQFLQPFFPQSLCVTKENGVSTIQWR